MTAVVDGGTQPLLVAEVDRVRAALEAYRAGQVPPPEPADATAAGGGEAPVDRLTRLLGLSRFERRVLLLAAAVELDGQVAGLVAELQGGDPRPTFSLALAAFPGAHWDALAPASPLRRWRLVDLGPGPVLASRPLQLDERVLHLLTGVPARDERLDGVVLDGPLDGPLAPSQGALAAELARTVAGVGAPVLVELDGDDPDGRLGVARRLALLLGRRPMLVRARALPPPGPPLAALARLVDREARLVESVPVVDAADAGDPAGAAALVGVLEAPLVVVVGGDRADGPGGGRLRMRRSVDLPPPGEQRALWRAALGDAGAGLAAAVDQAAHHFRFGAAAVDEVGRELRAAPGADPRLLRRLCRERSRVRLDGLAERVEPVARWADLVLPAGQLALLRDMARQVRHRARVHEDWGFAARSRRGLGVTALFSGESGTGKTLAAEVLAAELDLDLYRIDLAATVSKYIGETEKNLRRLFDAAEAGGAVLLFDEADALFGKRGEVRDGHDRYANLEVAYLLQRMETYRGLAILTTNLRSNVDRAFLRRLRFVVQFPFPDEAHRAELWRRAFPAATPLDGVDPERLAGLAVTGGSIASIALAAAFAAADEGTAVTPAHVLQAARVEYAKAERTLTAAETAGLA